MTQCQDEFRNLSGRVILILIKLRISNCCILLTAVFIIVLGPFLPMLVIFFSGSPFQVKTNTFKKKSSLLCTWLFILSLPYPKFSSMAIKPRFEMLEGNCGDRVDAGQGQFWAPLTTDGPSAGCSCKK